MDEETSPIINPLDRTEILFSAGRNECSVTNLPYETPDTRRQLVEIVEQAINDGKTIVFVYGDMDNLKVFNDLHGHNIGNLAIRRMVSGSQEVLLKQNGIESVFFYRPQAGGDEIKILAVLNESETGLSDEVLEALNEPFVLEWNGYSKEVECSFGVNSVRFSGAENAAEQLEGLEMKAEEELDTIKVKKVISQVDEIIEAGKKMGVDEFRQLITSTWLVRGPSGSALNLLLKYFEAKIVKRTLAQE